MTPPSIMEYERGSVVEVTETGHVGTIVDIFLGPITGEYVYVIDGLGYHAIQLRPVPQSLRVKP